ncbi:MAG TPA: DUF5777 family beta-barrel protein [Vicinamibacterales bacterium]|nr:DUF5777 family beta-barrel protein [Vicinamibacterales bacterium]
MSAPRVVVLVLAISMSAPAYAQNPAPAAADDIDLDPNPSQPDFVLVNLPTTVRLPRMKSAFRVTHRFLRALGQDDFGSLAEDLFGLDNGAIIGLEYRFGLARGLQAGVLRTSDRTISFFGQYNVLNQRSGAALGLGVLAGVDGTNNFRDDYSPAFGLAISRELGDHGAVYVEPVWVHNSNLEDLPGDDNSSFLVGLGARLRVRPTVYLTGEFTPRAGYSPGAHQGSFAIEKRAGGHVFQLNFSNGFGNTMGQLARGGTSSDDWYLGFNISRKFF